MADAAVVTKIYEDKEKVVYHGTLISDGSGETETIVADKSGLDAADGATEPTSLALLDLRCSMQGFSKLLFEWKHTSNVAAAIPSTGSYMEDFGAR